MDNTRPLSPVDHSTTTQPGYLPQTTSQYISVRTFAQMCDISEKSVRRMIESRDIPYLRLGHTIRIPVSVITDHIIHPR